MLIVPHPELLLQLFSNRYAVFSLFQNLIRPEGIDHIAVHKLNEQGQLSILSSTPAIEHTLFQNGLWQYDKSYQYSTFNEIGPQLWETLYEPHRRDELYYVKQQRPQFKLGVNFVIKNAEESFLISLAYRNQNQIIEKQLPYFLEAQQALIEYHLHKFNALFEY